MMAIVTLLKNDPTLKTNVRHFLYYNGQDVLDDADADNIPKPFIRLHVRPGASGWFAAGQHKFPVHFMLEIAVNGTNSRNILKLWSQIRVALSPRRMAPSGNLTVLQVLQAGGLATWKISGAAYGIENGGKGELRYLYGYGIVDGDLLVNT
jgi:hypothetical protein